MIDYFNMMSMAASTSNTASQTSVIVAITVAAIGAVATFTVGFLNFRTQKSQGGRQLELTLSSQMTDRFTKAIDQLGSEKKAVRIGGIFALERIARDSLKDENANYTLQSVAYTLATFVRETQPRAAVHESAYIPMLKIRAPDVQAAMTVLCRSPLCDNRVNADNASLRDLNRTDLRLDLSRTDLRRASLSGARLDGVNLWGTRLEGANLRRAHLRCAGLSDAYVGRLNPDDKDYKYGADLSGADLTDAYLNNVRGLDEAKKKGIRGLRKLADHVRIELNLETLLERLWPVLAASLGTVGLLVFTWRDGPPAPHPLQELQSRQVGRHTYTVLTEILDPDGAACRTRYLYRITEGGKVISEEQITGYSNHPAGNVLQRELAAAGFTQAEEAGELLAWRLV